MDEISLFLYFWIGMVAFMMVSGLILGLAELRSGTARMNFWMGARVLKAEEPVHYWFAVTSKFLMVPLGSFMIWFAIQTFWS